MSYVKLRVCMLAIIGLALQMPCRAQTVGNAPGETSTISGPSAPMVDLGACKFSINLLPGQTATFNDPDLILYYGTSKKDGGAYLSQAETNFGSSWSFKKKGSLRDKWMGLMCESTENFSKLMPNDDVSPQPESTPALNEIRQGNDLRCPATLTAGKWIPRPLLKRNEGYIFKEISGDGWSGFLIGYKTTKRTKELVSLRFCAVSGSRVLIGATENGDRPLALPDIFLNEVEGVLSTIIFSH